MQQEQTGLRGNDDPHFLSEIEAAATFEGFFGEEYLDVTKQLRFIGNGESLEKWNAPLDRLEPILGKRLRA
jgi:hypothetical protein